MFTAAVIRATAVFAFIMVLLIFADHQRHEKKKVSRPHCERVIHITTLLNETKFHCSTLISSTYRAVEVGQVPGLCDRVNSVVARLLHSNSTGVSSALLYIGNGETKTTTSVDVIGYAIVSLADNVALKHDDKWVRLQKSVIMCWYSGHPPIVRGSRFACFGLAPLSIILDFSI